MVRKLKILTIDHIVNIILNILKRPCTTFLLLLQIYEEVFCKRSLLKLLNKILEKYLNERSFLVRLQVLKMNLFTRVFQGVC